MTQSNLTGGVWTNWEHLRCVFSSILHSNFKARLVARRAKSNDVMSFWTVAKNIWYLGVLKTMRASLSGSSSPWAPTSEQIHFKTNSMLKLHTAGLQKKLSLSVLSEHAEYKLVCCHSRQLQLPTGCAIRCGRDNLDRGEREREGGGHIHSSLLGEQPLYLYFSDSRFLSSVVRLQ